MSGLSGARRLGWEWLALASTVYLVANLVHSADHLRQHLAGVDVEVGVGGGLLTALALLVVVAAWRRHPRAPLLAMVVGFVSAVLVAASHIAPHWGVLSDSYVNDIRADALSWAVVLVEIATGLILGAVGAYCMRAQAQGSSASEWTDPPRTAALPGT